MRRCLGCLTVVFTLLWLSLLGTDEVPLVPHITVEIPVRDGVKLPTDIYLPSENARGLPCILVRAPNGRKSHWALYAPLAKEGYAVAIQDTRSCLDPEGKSMPYMTDGWGQLQDGYDTVQWLATSPYTNGKIGTVGISAQGITQLLMAPSNPPNLVCQHVGVAAASIYDQALYAGGQLRKQQVEGWLGYYAPHPSVLQFVMVQHTYNDFWKEYDTAKAADRVHVPAVHHGGWYDTFLQGTIDAFVSRQEHGGEGARGRQKMIIGPWTHWWPDSLALGDFIIPDLGQHPPVDYSPKRWFDYHLKGIENGIDDIPTVTYYVMGPFDGSPSSGNVWRIADTWPPKAKATPFFLAESGKLLESLPDTGKVAFQYDPANPTPTLGGRNLFLKAGPCDQRPIEGRSDVVVFSTEPLTKDVEVTGHVRAQILFASEQQDTDVVVRLSDVYPDGRSILIVDGIRRLGDVVPHDFAVGKTQGPRQIDVDLWSTSIVFAKGHRIRISISSSNYPRYDKNPNVPREMVGAEAPQVANNSVYFGGVHGSRIILPIVMHDPLGNRL